MAKTSSRAVDRKHNYAVEVWLDIRECPVCGIVYGVPQDFLERRRNEGDNWHCPNGHSLHFTTLEVNRQRERADAAERRAQQAEEAARTQRERAEAAHRSARAYKGQITRIKNRIAAGVCPVPGCKRTGLRQAMRHIAAKHPGWAAEHEHELAQ